MDISLILSGFLITFILALVIFKKWSFGVVLVFIWLYFEDTLRKYLPGQPSYIILLKDIPIFLIYLSFLGESFIKKRKFWKPAFFTLIFVLGTWSLAQVFNPSSPNLWFAGIGLRKYFWYVPFLWLGYNMFDSKEKLLKFCRALVYSALILSAIAFFQYLFFKELPAFLAPLETTHAFHDFHALGGEKIKLVPSVFSSGERYSRFTFFLFLLGIGLFFYPKSSQKQKLLLGASTLAALLGVFISGRRAPMLLSLIGALVWLLIYYQKDFLKIFQLKIKKPLGIILLIFLITSATVFLVFDDIFKYFWTIGPKMINRVWLFWEEAFVSAKISGFWGLGIGMRSQGLHFIPGGEQYFQEEIDDKRLWIESGPGSTLIELGVVGLVIYTLLYGQMFFEWIKQIVLLKENSLYGLGISIFVFLFLMLIWFSRGHQIFSDSHTLIFFWFFMGILFKLKTYE